MSDTQIFVISTTVKQYLRLYISTFLYLTRRRRQRRRSSSMGTESYIKKANRQLLMKTITKYLKHIPL